MQCLADEKPQRAGHWDAWAAAVGSASCWSSSSSCCLAPQRICNGLKSGADSTLCLVVGKGHVQIGHKGPYCPLVEPPAGQQVRGWALFAPPALFGWTGCAHRPRMGGASCHQHPVVASGALVALGLIACRLALHEQRGPLHRPTLLLAFLDALQFPQGLGMTQTVGDIGRGAGRRPVVVHGPPGPDGHNPAGIQGCGAALRRHGLRGQPLRTGRVAPWRAPGTRRPLASKWPTGAASRHGSFTCALAGCTAAALPGGAVTPGPCGGCGCFAPVEPLRRAPVPGGGGGGQATPPPRPARLLRPARRQHGHLLGRQASGGHDIHYEQSPQSARRNNCPGEQISRWFLVRSENLSASNYPGAAYALFLAVVHEGMVHFLGGLSSHW
jgi:hypothetical protein